MTTARNPVLIDSNLLVLFAVGSLDPLHIGRFKRTKAYSIEDFQMLEGHLVGYSEVVITPTILAEVSNLTGQLADPLRTQVRANLALSVTAWTETYTPSAKLMRDPLFLRFGLTDTAIRIAAGKSVTVVTDDFPLYNALNYAGVPAINFNHLRVSL